MAGEKFEGWTEAKMEELFNNIRELRAGLSAHVEVETGWQREIEQRLDKLNNWRAWVMGIAFAVGIVASYLGATLS